MLVASQRLTGEAQEGGGKTMPATVAQTGLSRASSAGELQGNRWRNTIAAVEMSRTVGQCVSHSRG